MDERQQSINFAINLIQNICENSDICLIAMELKGIKCVGVHDNIENKDYCLIKDK